MGQIALEELARDTYHPIASVFLKYASELETIVRKDGYGFHYFIYVGARKSETNPITEKAVALFRSLVAELLSSEEDVRSHPSHPLVPWHPHYWPGRDGGRDYQNRHYATMSLLRHLGSGPICESVHFFLLRESFDTAIQYAKPAGWDHYD